MDRHGAMLAMADRRRPWDWEPWDSRFCSAVAIALCCNRAVLLCGLFGFLVAHFTTRALRRRCVEHRKRGRPRAKDAGSLWQGLERLWQTLARPRGTLADSGEASQARAPSREAGEQPRRGRQDASSKGGGSRQDVAAGNPEVAPERKPKSVLKIPRHVSFALELVSEMEFDTAQNILQTVQSTRDLCEGL